MNLFNIDLPIMSQNKLEQYFLEHPEWYSLNNQAGIYGIFLDKECVYIGESHDLLGRILTHMKNFNLPAKYLKTNSDYKYKILKHYKKHISIRILQFTNKRRKQIEKEYIDKYKPIFNISIGDKRQYFIGNEEDIDDFICGLSTMDDLKTMVSYKAPLQH